MSSRVRALVAAATAAVLAILGLGAAAPSSATPASTAPNLGAVGVKLKTVISGLASPIALTWRHGDARMYVAEQRGDVRIVNTNGSLVASPVLSLGSSNLGNGDEEGLLGLAFSPNGSKLYVDYTGTNGDIHIVEYAMAGDHATTHRELLAIPHHLHQNHNGGNLVFGPDSDLYISVGDGGGGGDPENNAQNTNALLGKILRINVTPSGGKQYTIPSDNPFFGQSGKRGEIWMYGLRNPWRYSFDKSTHDMLIADVGQDLYEEVDFAPAGQKGQNWGWNLREGFHAYNGGAKPPGAKDPMLEAAHTAGYCAIVGGYVYRGNAIPNLHGAYLFGDNCRSNIVGVAYTNGHVTAERDLGINVSGLSTFGQDPSGELYAADIFDGIVYKLVPATPPTPGTGYFEADAGGRVWGFGGATSCNSTRNTAASPVVGIASHGDAYWTVERDGTVNTCRTSNYGSMHGKHLNLPIVGMAATPSGHGYWLVASDGGMFGYGDAHFYGSMGGKHLNKPIVGMTSTPSGKGYWFVASDGGMFGFGDAHFYGSMGGKFLKRPIVGMAASHTGHGYWFVASDGGIFGYGDAHFHGSTGGRAIPAPITGMAASKSGNGYWFVGARGGLYAYGDAANHGTVSAHDNPLILGIARD